MLDRCRGLAYLLNTRQFSTILKGDDGMKMRWFAPIPSMTLAVMLALVVTHGLMLGPEARAQDDKDVLACDNATIRGDYGIQMQGTRPTPPPTDVIETVVGVLLRSFDGDGNFEQVDNIKGSVTGIVPDRTGTGTYEVFPDCSGVTEFQPDPNNPNLVIRERFVILDNGNEIRAMAETPAPLMVTTVGKRVLKP
jgi:hypothetical protein